MNLKTIVPLHEPLWQKLQQAFLQQRLAQALLLVGPRHAQITTFAKRLIQTILCHKSDEFGCDCRACHLCATNLHPDVNWLKPSPPSGPIKIEQIRDLQQSLYHTPQLGQRSIIVLEPADKLNQAAANALLKILEEPPAHVTFILIAEHLMRMPATIISRCQKYIFSAPPLTSYLALQDSFKEDLMLSQVIEYSPTILETLKHLRQQNITPSQVAQAWQSYGLPEILWLLYLLYAEMVRVRLLELSKQKVQTEPLIQELANMVAPEHIFIILSEIRRLIGKAQRHITLNTSLALEVILLKWCSE